MSTAFSGGGGAGFYIASTSTSNTDVNWVGSPQNTNTSHPADQLYLIEAFYNAGVSRYIYQNGSLVANDPTATSRNTTSATLLVASSIGGYPAMKGTISEILIYNTNHTTNERQSVESYLAWKWNIQSRMAGSVPVYTPGVNGWTGILPLGTQSLYTPGNVAKWAIPRPTTIQQSLDRMAALLYTLNGNTAIP
jgi:hypothetical protein